MRNSRQYISSTMVLAGTDPRLSRSHAAVQTSVPKIIFIPEMQDHDNRNLKSLQMTGTVKAYRFRNGDFVLEWHPFEQLLKRGYETSSFQAGNLIEAINGLFSRRNTQTRLIAEVELLTP
ncbi:hypothetical protein [Rubinisphaera italica]|uniref:Uncharacterized protein n=1 Tax=Rubinisphaera italica TaxID=2527969 RepID=A0A5C5XN34_9PLAN|nr:hypothetical protein [Rubinisphaera italica]TWT63162.1 hypothetical protein Pan54_39150 [Rubinisphaera italica]